MELIPALIVLGLVLWLFNCGENNEDESTEEPSKD